MIALARDNLNPELDVLGVVLNMANMRTNHARQTLETLHEHFGEKVFETVIRRSIAYAESAERAIPILRYRADRGVDYLRLAAGDLRPPRDAGAPRGGRGDGQRAGRRLSGRA